MSATIFRSEPAAARTVPPITAPPYDAPAGDTPAGRLLRSAGRPSRRVRLGRDPSPERAVGRLLWLHAQAIRAEQRGRFRRANHWWTEATAQLDRLSVTDPAWEAARTAAGFPGDLDAVALRAAVVRELFLDTHLAFRNAYGPTDRGRWHWEAAQRLFDAARLTRDQRAELEITREAGDAADPDQAYDRLTVLEGKYVESSLDRVRRAKVDLCRTTAEAAAGRDDVTAVRWVERLAGLEPDSADVRGLRRRMYRDAVRRAATNPDWDPAGRFAEAFANYDPDSKVPEADADYQTRAGIRRALSAKAWTAAVTGAENLRRLHKDDDADVWKGRARDVGWTAVGAAWRAGDWPLGATLATRLRPVQSEDERAVAAALKAAANKKALDAIPPGFRAGLPALETLLDQFPHDPDVHLAAVKGILDRTRVELDVYTKPNDNVEAARTRAGLVTDAINRLTGALDRNPALAAAGEGLAVLHFLRAVQYANGSRPADALVDLEAVEGYDPTYPDLAASRAKVEDLLTDMGRMVRQVKSQLGSRYEGGRMVTSVLNAEGMAMSMQVDKGTAARDQFRRSDAQSIRAKVRRAGQMRYWLRAGMPPPGDDWPAKARAFDEATDLLYGRKPETGADVLVSWLTILNERPDLTPHLGDVGLDNVLAAFMKQSPPEDAPAGDPVGRIPQPGDLSWLDEPSPYAGAEIEVHAAALAAGQSPAADLAPPPRLAVPAKPPAHTLDSDLPPEVWLFSRRDLRVKAVAATAAVVFLIACGVGVADAATWSRRDRAYNDLRAGLTSKDEAAVRDSLRRLDEATPILPSRTAKDQARHVEGVSFALAHLDRQRTRDEAAARLAAAAQKRDPAGVKTAASEFMAARASEDRDPRVSAVNSAAKWADELPALAKRDAAYARVRSASAAGDHRATVAAAVEFLQAKPAAIQDVRTDEVAAAGRTGAAHWVLTARDAPAGDDARLIKTLTDLTPNR